MLKALDSKLWLWTGFLIGMPAIKLFGIALYNILLIIIVTKKALEIIIYHEKICVYRYKFLLYIFFSILMLSSLLCFRIVDSEWFEFSVRAAIKLSLVLIIIVLIFKDSEFMEIRKRFFEGLYKSAIINTIWIFLQLLVWGTTRMSLNEIVFNNNPVKIVYMVLTGLSHERADTVLLLSIATILSNSVILNIFFLTGIFLTASRSGFIMLLTIYIYKLYLMIRKRKIHTNKLRNFFVVLILLVIGTIGIYFGEFSFSRYLIENGRHLFERFLQLQRTGSMTLEKIDPHIRYYLWAADAIKRMPVMQLLFGCGTRCSGWVYSEFYNYYTTIGPWTIECDFLSILFGNGLIGVIVYYGILFKIFLENKKDEMKILIFVIFVAGFFYQFYTGTLVLLLIILMFSKEKNDLSANNDMQGL